MQPVVWSTHIHTHTYKHAHIKEGLWVKVNEEHLYMYNNTMYKYIMYNIRALCACARTYEFQQETSHPFRGIYTYTQTHNSHCYFPAKGTCVCV